MGKKETWSEARDRRRERRVIRRDERRLRREGLSAAQPTVDAANQASTRVSDPDISQDNPSQVIGIGNGSRRGVNRLAFLAWGNPDAHQVTPEERMARPLQERLFEVHGLAQGNEAEDSELRPPTVTPEGQLRDLLRQRRAASSLWDDDK